MALVTHRAITMDGGQAYVDYVYNDANVLRYDTFGEPVYMIERIVVYNASGNVYLVTLERVGQSTQTYQMGAYLTPQEFRLNPQQRVATDSYSLGVSLVR